MMKRKICLATVTHFSYLYPKGSLLRIKYHKVKAYSIYILTLSDITIWKGEKLPSERIELSTNISQGQCSAFIKHLFSLHTY